MYVVVGVSVRALMESAAESGYTALAIDYFGDQDCRWSGKTIRLGELGFSPAASNLLQAAEMMVFSHSGCRQQCQGLIYAAGPENCPDKLASWDARGLLRGNSTTTLQHVRNPWELSAALSVNCSVPRFYPWEEWQPQKAGKTRWLVKPVNSGGGRDITWLAENNHIAQSQVAALGNEKNKYIIQEYIPGITASATFLADGEQAVIVGTSRQLIQQDEMYPSRFDYTGSIVPLNLPAGTMDELLIKLEKVAGCLTRTFKLKGINTVDFIINAREIWVLEVNPRWSASVELIERWRGERLFTHHLAAVNAENKWTDGCRKRVGKSTGYWGKKIIYAQRKVTVKATDTELRYYYTQGLRDIPVPGTCITRGQPLCTVLAWGETNAACRVQLTCKAAWAETALSNCMIPAELSQQSSCPRKF